MNIQSFVMQHKIKVDPQPGAVFAKYKGREVSCLYSATANDEIKALEVALTALGRLCGLPVDDGANLPASGVMSVRYGNGERLRNDLRACHNEPFYRPKEFKHIRQLAAQIHANREQML